MGGQDPGPAATPGWWIYRGTGAMLDAADRDRRWPPPPRWRAFDGGPDQPVPPQDDPDLERRLGAVVVSAFADESVTNLVNAALYLRRPLLVTGSPGVGRSSLAYQIARELQLGRVLRWQVTASSTIHSGLYEYDAVGWAYAAGRRAPEPGGPGAEPDLGKFVHLGPLGTALLPYRLPRVLLIDDLDQSDIDLPHQLHTVFDEGGFEIRELVRVAMETPQVTVYTADPARAATVRSGRVRCHEFPVVVMTSSDERELPSTLRQQCLQLRIPEPDETRLTELITAHFPGGADSAPEVLGAYLERRARVEGLASSQLLDAVYLRESGAFSVTDRDGWDRLVEAMWQPIPLAGP